MGSKAIVHLFGTEEQGKGEDLLGKTFHAFETGLNDQNCIHSNFYTSKRKVKVLTGE